MEKESEEVVVVSCSCGCGELKVTKWPDDNTYNLTYWYPAFHGEQQGIFSEVIKRLKNAWFSLQGKEFRAYDILLQKDEWDKFIKDISFSKEDCKQDICNCKQKD